MNNILTKKLVGTAGIVVALFATLFVGVSSASAYFQLTGKNVQFHAIIESMTPTSMVLLTSSTDPITVIINSKTKYPFGPVNTGDVIFFFGKLNKDGIPVGQIIKKSSSGGPSDIYGTDGDKVIVKKVKVKDSQCPWLSTTKNDDLSTIVFKTDANTHFIGTLGCTSLVAGDVVSITGIDTDADGFVAKSVIKHKKGKDSLPDDEDE